MLTYVNVELNWFIATSTVEEVVYELKILMEKFQKYLFVKKLFVV